MNLTELVPGSKTRFSIKIDLRIAKESTQEDKFTKEEILLALQNGAATIWKGHSSSFVVLSTQNNKIMAEIENMEIE